jgi:periplasmic protein TonB
MGTKFEDFEKNPAKKLTGIGIVILLHVLVVAVLIASMAKEIIKPSDKPVEMTIIQEVIPPPIVETPPEPPKIVEKVAKTPDVQKPVEKVVPVVKPVTTPTVAPTTPTVAAPVASPSPSPSPVATPAPAADPGPPVPKGETRGVSDGEAGCKAPPYPRDALMAEEQGNVVISVYVGTDGKVKESKVKKSSGSRNLDRAASKSFSLCSFKPALKNGEPQESWYDIPYEFVLN